MQHNEAILAPLYTGHVTNHSTPLYRPDQTVREAQKPISPEPLLAILELLQNNTFDEKRLLPLVLIMKNAFQRSGHALTKNELIRLLIPITKANSHLSLALLINNLTFILAKKNDKQFFEQQCLSDRDFFSTLKKLQNALIYIQVFKQPAYQLALKNIKDLSSVEVSFFDKVFRYFNAINNGIGLWSVTLGWGPMALIGFLGFLSCVVPPVGIVILNIVFGSVGALLGGILSKNLLHNYRAEDNSLTQQIQDAENNIHALAHDQAKLLKERYIFNYKINRLLRSTDDVKNEAQLPDLKSPKHVDKPIAHKTTQIQLPWRLAMGFLGALGTIWGVPSLICGLCGVSLIIGSAFLTGGLVLATSALVIAGVVTYINYRYEKKTDACKNKIDVINKKGIEEINKCISDEHNTTNALKNKYIDLKMQIMAEKREKSENLLNAYKELDQSNLALTSDAVGFRKKRLDGGWLSKQGFFSKAYDDSAPIENKSFMAATP